MTLAMAGSLIGGLGLFMLGMQLMTDGLKFAAGNTLREILEQSTSTPLRGILSGAFITSLVQSSSAVTVATIGFVNAGLMNLQQAVTVIYGSNIGTTMTGWLVALIGFQFKIKAFALPMIGLGMLAHLLKKTRKSGALGEALAGFGLFFLGIDILKNTFSGLGSSIQLADLGGGGYLSILLFLGIGCLLTVFMQSSSASIAIALTATAGGIIPLNDAAAVVIGANIGTTSTAAFAVLGATPNAKRIAAAHVSFNLITGAVAILILPLLLMFLTAMPAAMDVHAEAATVLALFHTIFNVLGVLLMLPITRKLVQFLKKRFRSFEENEAQPVYLDRNVLGTPVLAIHAMAKELERVGAIARRMAQSAISSEIGPGIQLDKDEVVLTELQKEICNFATLLQRSHLPPELDNLLPNALRVSGYYRAVAELSLMVARAQREIQLVQLTGLAETIADFKGGVIRLLEKAAVEKEGYTVEDCSDYLARLVAGYKELKARLLRAGTRGELPVGQMVRLLEQLSFIRRIAEQTEKGARYLTGLTAVSGEASEQAENAAGNPP